MYQELKEIFGEAKDTPASHNDLQNMKYLEMVIKEALRLYTTVPFIARIVTEDIEYGKSRSLDQLLYLINNAL